MGKQIRYSSEFKIETVQNYFKGELSATELAKNLGVHPNTVRHWIQDYTKANNADINTVSNVNKVYVVAETKKKTEDSKKSEINSIFLRFSVLEKDVKDLKTILMTYIDK